MGVLAWADFRFNQETNKKDPVSQHMSPLSAQQWLVVDLVRAAEGEKKGSQLCLMGVNL